MRGHDDVDIALFSKRFEHVDRNMGARRVEIVIDLFDNEQTSRLSSPELPGRFCKSKPVGKALGQSIP
jgi:hypothetical protein